MIERFRIPVWLAVAAAIMLGGMSPALSQGRNNDGRTHVYLLRGLLNIFSLGMDDLANKLNARGVYATVHNHGEWQSISDAIAARYRAGNRSPIILIGHSLGADAIMQMGEYLGNMGVPVALLVPFDGTASFPASRNVARVFNVTQRDYARMTRGPGFRGELVNMDVSGPNMDHTSIDKSARLHALVINRVLAVAGRGGGGGGGPTHARPHQPSAEKPAASDATSPAGASAAAKPQASDGTAVPAKPAVRSADVKVQGAATDAPATTASVPAASSKPAASNASQSLSD